MANNGITKHYYITLGVKEQLEKRAGTSTSIKITREKYSSSYMPYCYYKTEEIK